MGKNKLTKFDDMAHFPHVFQYSFEEIQERGCELKGHWGEFFFKNSNPIVLELGCGKGEYTVGLGKLFPEKNFIGIDVKGARMWTGAKESFTTSMTNVAFLRTNIEMLTSFFVSGEVSEIWLTFPDPQMKKLNKRLTSTRFIQMYQGVLTESGVVHLKTDSNFMYTYTCEMAKANQFEVLFSTDDLYHSALADDILSIRTYYEQQWLDRGLNIKYIKFVCGTVGARNKPIEPDIEIELDPYRSFNRSKRSALASTK